MPFATNQEYAWHELLDILQCPSCRRSFLFQEIDQGLQHGREYGLLKCGCTQYPVVDGIPILTSSAVGAYEHTRGGVEYQGPSPEELTRLVLARRGLDALLRCIAFPIVFKRLLRIPPRRLWLSRRVLEILAGLRRFRFRRRCMVSREVFAAEDWFDVFFRQHSPLRGDMFSYFFYRFSQPRHLATLQLTGYLPAGKKPLLDLACGFGHLGHSLAESPLAHAVVGVDRNFFGLWTAQYWIAPKNRFVCADADKPLPFANDVFKAVLCSDAFHYFLHKDLVLQEITRCAPRQPVLLARVGNKLAEPNEGFELTPEAYAVVCGDPAWRIFGENELLRLYLSRNSAGRLAPRGTAKVEHEKWLYLVYPGEPPISPQFQVGWPHATGRLQINPIFKVSRIGDGNRRLQLRFPSQHYASENKEMTAYLPSEITITDGTYQQVKANVRSPEVESLIKQMVVIGVPERYTRA